MYYYKTMKLIPLEIYKIIDISHQIRENPPW